MRSAQKKPARAILGVLVLLFTVTSLSGAVMAHGGRTDSNGGHTDSSTGEYHYHHGYPAHQHEDLDGDGQLECPYEFVDRTGENSGSSSGSSSSGENSGSSSGSSSSSVKTSETAIKEVTVYRTPVWAYISFGVLGIIAIWSAISASDSKRALAAADEEFDEIGRELDALCIGLSQNDERWLLRISGAGPHDSTGWDGLPQDGDKYIFYASTTNTHRRSSVKYHRRNCRYAAGLTCVNAVEIKKQSTIYTPCAVCNPVLPDTAWFEKYSRYKSFLDKYRKSEAEGSKK